MPHVGHRDNPAIIDSPGALDRAVARVWQPTEGQASAGNYQMAHAVVGGLHVTVETPLDRTRSGVGPDGTPWSVRMPAHYGYAKRTEGADGDHVDVYIGPHAHRADRLPVWVVDQIDADSGKFDEHKSFLGFADAQSVARAYEAAFSDGRGRERCGACMRMSFDQFTRWLRTGAKTPVAYARSALFSASSCSCGCTHHAPDRDFGGLGGPMTTATAAAVPVTAKGAGILQTLVSKMWPSMTAQDRADLLAGAASESVLAVGKATDLLEQGDDHERPGRVEDLFDGPPDDELKTVAAHGPNSSVPPGKVAIGPVQMASGGGAASMEREYSQHSPQAGVQAATEALGRKLAGQMRMMKATVAAVKSMLDRMSMFEQAMTTVAAPPALDKAAIDSMVAKAVAAALPIALAKAIPTLVKAIAKASESDKEDDKESESGEEGEEEEEDDEAEETESGSGTEIEIVNENDDEDEAESDEKKAARKAGGRELGVAKALVRLAKHAALDAADSLADGRPAAGVRAHRKAAGRVAKARTHLAIAKSILGGFGPVAKGIAASVDAVAKAIKETKAKNQEKWPESHAKRMGTGKAEAPVATATGGLTPEAAKAIDDLKTVVEKANAGYALMTADVQKVLSLVGGQSREGPAGGTPPVGELFKGGLPGREGRLNAAYAAGEISAAERDKGVDALLSMRAAGMPADVVELSVAGCAPAVQAILRAAA